MRLGLFIMGFSPPGMTEFFVFRKMETCRHAFIFVLAESILGITTQKSMYMSKAPLNSNRLCAYKGVTGSTSAL